MNLIAETRPRTWNSIVGQPKALRLLQAILSSTKFMPKGFIFHGVYGVGKTTTAYIGARALMCTGNDPLGCGKCPSCQCVDQQGIDSHPDFQEVKAAENSGVENARDIVTQSYNLPVLGKRRVIMLDEAHRLSQVAWDAFLSVLEQKDTDSIFLFVTNDVKIIPATIRSRCAKLKFSQVSAEIILGLLTNIANTQGIDFELDALKVIAWYAKGHVRNAVEMLASVACLGTVTKELVSAVVDLSLEDYCFRILAYIANGNQLGAVSLLDEACLTTTPSGIVEALFSTYGRIVYSPENSQEELLASTLVPVTKATTIFLKWGVMQNIPVDAMPLLIYELMTSRLVDSSKELEVTRKIPIKVDEFCTMKQFASLMGGTIVGL